mgnify:CR=1 FL=1|tara:strand:+ start:2451 stop:2900 length:450 start_codon:yes stop_codon:yes gene_type:complete
MFFEDLAFGHKYENLFLKSMQYKKCYRPSGVFKYYDVCLTDSKGKTTKYEIKADRIGQFTKQLTFELKYKGKYAGIISTKAKYIIYYVVNAFGYTKYKLPTSSLRKLILSGIPYKINNIGDNKQVTAIQIDSSYFEDFIEENYMEDDLI